MNRSTNSILTSSAPSACYILHDPARKDRIFLLHHTLPWPVKNVIPESRQTHHRKTSALRARVPACWSEKIGLGSRTETRVRVFHVPTNTVFSLQNLTVVQQTSFTVTSPSIDSGSRTTILTLHYRSRGGCPWRRAGSHRMWSRLWKGHCSGGQK